MSGCGSRAVMYFGILEVFQENNIPIDFMSSCSSATFIAAAYSSGHLQELKDFYMNMTSKELAAVFRPSFNGGLFHFDEAANILNRYIHEQNLEELPIPTAMVASDIRFGEKVVLTKGDINKAIKASCCMPGLLEPVIWGDKILIDGGLFHIVPAEAVKALGADIVIGVDLATTRNLFSQEVLYLKKGYNIVSIPFSFLFRILRGIQKLILDVFPFLRRKSQELKMPGMFEVLDKSMDYALEERRKGEHFHCDLIIKPSVKGFRDVDMGNRQAMYAEGRRAALEAIPKIKELLK